MHDSRFIKRPGPSAQGIGLHMWDVEISQAQPAYIDIFSLEWRRLLITSASDGLGNGYFSL